MNKIFGFFALALASTLLFSCSDDDNNSSTTANGVQVLTRATDIAPVGGQSAIEVDKPVTRTYTADGSAWLTLTADGNKVNLSAPANQSVESRHATVVIKASDTDSTVVSITQLGLVLSYTGGNVVSGNNGKTVAKYVLHNEPLNITKAPEWVNATVDGDSLRLTVQANTTGQPRGGYVYMQSGSMVDSLSVCQADFASLKGDYLIGGYDLQDGQMVFYNCKLYSRGNLYYMNMPDLKWTWDGVFNEDNLTFTCYNGTWIGTYQNSYYIAMLLMTSSGAVYADDTLTGDFQFTVADDGTVGAVLTGTIGDESIAGLAFAAFTSQNFNTYQGVLMGFAPAIIIKNDGTASAKAKAERMMRRMAPRPAALGKLPEFMKWK